MSKNKKGDYRIRDAYIQEDILRKADNNNLGYKIFEKYDVSEDVIFSFETSLENKGLLNMSSSQESGEHMIFGVTKAGKECYKLKLLSSKVTNAIDKQIVSEKRAERTHFLNGLKIWQFWVGIFGLGYTIFDILLKSILGKGILDTIF